MDREALLRVIAMHPHENTPRLEYADWLMQYGSCDRDAATSEFIRMSCSVGCRQKRMPYEVYGWLIKNWHRLVPKSLAVGVPVESGPTPQQGWRINWHNGRKKEVLIRLARLPPKRGGYRPFKVVFDFAFGFLDRCETWSPVSFGQLKQPLLADQPLCKVMCHGTTRHPQRVRSLLGGAGADL
ncbi:hypothetical protein GobsT_30810 [Gemmata obscuriglobus]|uniref:TIGR02996 domain-containing protein n=1 Tax=Gemmata obscuriglobus TaxID=114 RepID=A0A2Z3H583_9BACT|nr:TIGR02996 domain-containing protein [Gemmata obscuriglobus]AWM38726.1 TIGR02996 domain-containing protein [Gemmata obscuriglobus]QEG28304.1 hypothetical protein GobsT_30810 [Gemmata obscuriglobus]VTS06143.1 unnamed protein product [Gemmata obscuriglobus UQM 2246]